jgi:hypothetical protein
MAKEAATFNGGVESRMVHDNIRRRIQKQCGRSVCFLNLVSKKDRWSLLRFVLVFFFFFSVAPMTTLWQAICSY